MQNLGKTNCIGVKTASIFVTYEMYSCEVRCRKTPSEFITCSLISGLCGRCVKLVCIQNLRKGIFFKKFYDIPYFDDTKFVEVCFKISWIFLFFTQFVLTSFEGPSIFVAL